MSAIDVDKATAADALRKAAVYYDDPDHGAFGRTLIHCFLGGFGADWDLDAALRTLSKADRVAWIDSIFGHDLAIQSEGRVYQFDVRRPGAER